MVVGFKLGGCGGGGAFFFPKIEEREREREDFKRKERKIEQNKWMSIFIGFFNIILMCSMLK